MLLPGMRDLVEEPGGSVHLSCNLSRHCCELPLSPAALCVLLPSSAARALCVSTRGPSWGGAPPGLQYKDVQHERCHKVSAQRSCISKGRVTRVERTSRITQALAAEGAAGSRAARVNAASHPRASSCLALSAGGQGAETPRVARSLTRATHLHASRCARRARSPRATPECGPGARESR